MATRLPDRLIRLTLLVLACGSLGCRVTELLAPKLAQETPQAATALPAPMMTAVPSPAPPTPTLRPAATATVPVAAGVYGPFVAIAPDPPDGAVYDVRVALDGALWLSAESGLHVLRAGAWEQIAPTPAIILGFDGAARVWTAGEAGDQVTVWSGRASRIMGTESGWTPAGTISRALPYATVSEQLITDGRGWSWLATSHDVRAFDGGRWRVFSPEEAGFTHSAEMVDMGFGFRFRDVAIDSTGDVWVSDCAWGGPGPVGQGARWYDGQTWDGQTSSVVGSGCIEDIEVDAAGRIWLGINGDLWRYSVDQGWRQFTHPEGALGGDLRWGYIIDVVLGGEETAWVTMAPCGGASCDTGSTLLYRVRGGEWTQVSDAGIADLALDQDGNGWICVGNGLYRVTAGEMALAYEESAFACRLEGDGKRYTWLWQPDAAGLWVHNSVR